MANKNQKLLIMSEILDHFGNENSNAPKNRHGCVTAWLVLMILGNFFSAISYFFFGDTIASALPSQPSMVLIWAIGIMAIINVVFTVMLFQWKKMGFYGFIGTSALAFVINLMIGIGVLQSVAGLLGVIILYGILQIKGEGNIAAWDHLE